MSNHSSQKNDPSLEPFSWGDVSSSSEVLHEVRLNVKGLAGLMVERSECQDVAGERNAPPAPHEMRAVVAVTQNLQTRGTTSFSRSLKLSPTEDVFCQTGKNLSQSGSSVDGVQAKKRYVAVWYDDDSASVTFEVLLPKPKPNGSCVSLNSTEKNFELVVCLTDGTGQTAAIPIGEAQLPVSAEQTHSRMSFDLPVYPVTTTKGDFTPGFQAFDASSQGKFESLSTNLGTTYSIDKSGDSVLRVEVEVQEKEFNFEVDWEEAASTMQPSPPRLSRRHLNKKNVSITKAPTATTKGKPVVRVIDPSRIPMEPALHDKPRKTGHDHPMEPSIERVLTTLDEMSVTSRSTASGIERHKKKPPTEARADARPPLHGQIKKAVNTPSKAQDLGIHQLQAVQLSSNNNEQMEVTSVEENVDLAVQDVESSLAKREYRVEKSAHFSRTEASMRHPPDEPEEVEKAAVEVVAKHTDLVASGMVLGRKLGGPVEKPASPTQLDEAMAPPLGEPQGATTAEFLADDMDLVAPTAAVVSPSIKAAALPPTIEPSLDEEPPDTEPESMIDVPAVEATPPLVEETERPPIKTQLSQVDEIAEHEISAKPEDSCSAFVEPVVQESCEDTKSTPEAVSDSYSDPGENYHRPPVLEEQSKSEELSFSEENSFEEESLVVEDWTYATVEDEAPRPKSPTKLFGILDIPVCGKLQDVVEEHFGLDDDTYLDEEDDESTLATMETNSKRRSGFFSMRNADSFSTMERDDITQVPRPPDFLDNVCGRANLGCRPTVDVFNGSGDPDAYREHDFGPKSVLDQGSVGRRRRIWKLRLREMALRNVGDGTATEYTDLSRDESYSYDTYDDGVNTHSTFMRDEELGPILENDEGSSAYSRSAGGSFSIDKSRISHDGETASYITNGSGSRVESIGRVQRPWSDQESGTNALQSPRTSNYKQPHADARSVSSREEEAESVSKAPIPAQRTGSLASKSRSIMSEDSNPIGIWGPPVLARQADTTKQGGNVSYFSAVEGPRKAAKSGATEPSGVFSKQIEDSSFPADSTKSPNSLLDIPFVASFYDSSKGITDSIMQVVRCGVRGTEVQLQEIDKDTPDLPSIPSHLEPNADDSVGELTATSHEMKINIQRYRRELERAQKRLSSKIAATRKNAKEVLKIQPAVSQPVNDRVGSLRTVKDENYFEDYDHYGFTGSIESDAADAAWAKKMAEVAVVPSKEGGPVEMIDKT